MHKLKQFAVSTSGNVAIMAALAMVPLVGVAGMAVDYSRAVSTQASMQAAADAAVLAAAAAVDMTDRERKRYANRFFKSNFAAVDGISGLSGKLIISDDHYRYEVNGKVPTTISGILGYKTMPVAVAAEVGIGVNRLEVALALDTTGSMGPYMGTMRDAARDFVDTIEGTAAQSVKFAVVPFSNSVNVGRLLRSNEIDSEGDSKWQMDFVEGRNIIFESGETCGGTSGPVGSSTSERQSWLGIENGDWAGAAVRAILGISSAQAQSGGQYIGLFPEGWRSPNPCRYVTPPKQRALELFNNINVQWKGCVEARPEELDVADTPATGDPDTKWVPYFWPDEVPKGTPAITHNHYFAGAYQDLLPAAGLRYYVYGANSNVIKYNGLHAFNIDETAPDTLGPNKSCPDEALPLTNRLNNVRNKIASLSHWNDGGTVASEGIAWAMRMLSPGAPFTEGARPSKKLEKIIVLFGDGRNQLPVNIDNSPMRTDYSAYGYMFANTGRFEEYDKSALSDFSGLGPVDRLLKASQRVLDQRMRQACDNAKQQNIRILTILFNENDPETKALYQYCASEPEDALVAADPASLKNAFQTIAQKVLKLHLRK